jgi:hypothetical protein
MKKGILLTIGILFLNCLTFGQVLSDFESGLSSTFGTWANQTWEGAAFTSVSAVTDPTARATGQVMQIAFDGSKDYRGMCDVEKYPLDFKSAPVIGFWVYLPADIPSGYNIGLVGQDQNSWSDCGTSIPVTLIPKETWYPIYFQVKQLSLSASNFDAFKYGMCKLLFKVDVGTSTTHADSVWAGNILVDDITAYGSSPTAITDFESGLGGFAAQSWIGTGVTGAVVAADTTSRAAGNVLQVAWDGSKGTSGGVDKEPVAASSDIITVWVYLPSDMPNGYQFSIVGQDNVCWCDAADTISVSQIPKDKWFPITFNARQLSLTQSNFTPFSPNQIAKFIIKLTTGTASGADLNWAGTFLVDDVDYWGMAVPPTWVVDNFESTVAGVDGWYNNSGIHAAVDSLYQFKHTESDASLNGVLAAHFNFSKDAAGDISKDNVVVYDTTTKTTADKIMVNVFLPTTLPDGKVTIAAGPNGTWNSQDFAFSSIGKGAWKTVEFTKMSGITDPTKPVILTVQVALNSTASYDTTILFDNVIVHGIAEPVAVVHSPATKGSVVNFSTKSTTYDYVRLDWVDNNLGTEFYSIYQSTSPVTNLADAKVKRVAGLVPHGQQVWSFRPYTSDGSAVTLYYAVTASTVNSKGDTTETALTSSCEVGPLTVTKTSKTYKIKYVSNFHDSFEESDGDGTAFAPYAANVIKPEHSGGSAARSATWNVDNTDFNYAVTMVVDDSCLYIHGDILDIDMTTSSFGTINCWNGDAIEFYMSFYDRNSTKIWHDITGTAPTNMYAANGDYRYGINDLGEVNIGENSNGGMSAGYSAALDGSGWSFNFKVQLDSIQGKLFKNGGFFPLRIDANGINPDAPWNETGKSQVLQTGMCYTDDYSVSPNPVAFGLDNDWTRPSVFGSAELLDYPTAVKNTGNNLPKEFKLYNNYPNPFNPSTIIKYDLPKESQVLLKVYDILGKEVATIVNDKQKAGTYTLNFNASKFASGVYIYRITAGNYVHAQKMMLLK